MFIKTVNHNTKDVFLGKEWDNWVRVTRSGDKFLRTDGMHCPHPVLQKINDRIKAFEEGLARKATGVK